MSRHFWIIYIELGNVGISGSREVKEQQSRQRELEDLGRHLICRADHKAEEPDGNGDAFARCNATNMWHFTLVTERLGWCVKLPACEPEHIWKYKPSVALHDLFAFFSPLFFFFNKCALLSVRTCQN